MSANSEIVAWSKMFKEALEPHERAIIDGRLFSEMASGALATNIFRYALKNFYPLVESFPKLMGLCLAKASATGHGTSASGWLIHNIQIERRHAEWFRDWAIGFGVPVREFEQGVRPPPAMDAINHFLWRSCTYGDLVEAISSLNYAVEGPTGVWTKSVMKNIEIYGEREGIKIDADTLRWLRAHAHYDDHHPDEALEITLMHVRNKTDLDRAIRAAQDGMSYYAMAADACYELGAEA